jgi:hypothetical protein
MPFAMMTIAPQTPPFPAVQQRHDDRRDGMVQS